MRWLALDITWGSSAWLSVLSAECRLTWIELLCYVKGSGSEGRVRAMSAARFARMIYVGEESVTQLLKAAETHGALRIEDSDWVIVKWLEYQRGVTSTERVRKYREKRDETLRNVSETNVTLDKDKTETKTRQRQNPLKSPKGECASFSKFWSSYPKRKGSNPRQTALVAYERALAKGFSPEAIYSGLEAYKRSDPGERGAEFIAQAATWLNQRRWEDDYSEPDDRAAMIARLKEEFGE